MSAWSGSAALGVSATWRAMAATGARGVGLLGIDRATSRPTLILTGAGAGIFGVAAAVQAGSFWWAPVLVIWAVTLSTAAVCDARTQRIPAPLLRAGGCATAVLLVTASAATEDWRALILSFVAVAAASAILGACWRFAGVGFGDVRLAAVGGLGLGHTTHRALVLALVVVVAVTLSQATWTFHRTKDRRARFALGPALVAGFLVAAAL